VVAVRNPNDPDSARNSEIASKRNAIQRRLTQNSAAGKNSATQAANIEAAKLRRQNKGGKVTKKYTQEYIKGEKEGFSSSDFGVGKGAAIPYQIGKKTNTINRDVRKVNIPKPKPKPKPTPGHRLYTVKRGDNLSSIASKNGMQWQDIWNYNLKNRNPATVKTLKKRGPNLIYKGSTFYIPNR